MTIVKFNDLPDTEEIYCILLSTCTVSQYSPEDRLHNNLLLMKNGFSNTSFNAFAFLLLYAGIACSNLAEVRDLVRIETVMSDTCRAHQVSGLFGLH